MRLLLVLAAVLAFEQTQSEAPKVYEPGNGVTAPVLIKSVSPKYTSEAMQAGIEGVVELAVVVSTEGTVSEVTVTKSLDREHGLDAEAVKAAKQWLFKPGTREGKPVAVRIQLILEFRLKGNPSSAAVLR